MELRVIESRLPPGFRFYPSDEELVCHYLYRKVNNQRISDGTMVEVDLHNIEPWELPDTAKMSTKEWYFFSFRDRKYSTGSRTNRATKTGYWKATGKDRVVHDPTTHTVVGMRKTLVFYSGRAPNGMKSEWVMHEFRLDSPHMPPKEDWVLCRVFHKNKVDDNLSRSNSLESVDNHDYSMASLNCTPSIEQAQRAHASYCHLAVSSGFVPTSQEEYYCQPSLTATMMMDVGDPGIEQDGLTAGLLQYNHLLDLAGRCWEPPAGLLMEMDGREAVTEDTGYAAAVFYGS